jgi:hypothetical protein
VAALFRALDGMADKPVAEIKSREKLLAILIACEESQRLKDFINEGIFDKHLPFLRLRGEILRSVPEASKRIRPKVSSLVSSFRKWDRESQDQFLEKQWFVQAPWLDLRIDNTPNPPLLELDKRIPLPFIKVHGASNVVHDGDMRLGWMEPRKAIRKSRAA